MSYAISLAEERKEGRREGQREERLVILRRLVFMSGVSTDEALSMIGVPADEWAQYRQELEEIRKTYIAHKKAPSFGWCCIFSGAGDGSRTHL